MRVDTLEKNESIRGDKLRDLVLIVYLNNKYGLGTKIEDSRVQNFLCYSRSGFNTELNESGYFVRKGDEITLSEKGERYVKKLSPAVAPCYGEPLTKASSVDNG